MVVASEQTKVLAPRARPLVQREKSARAEEVARDKQRKATVQNPRVALDKVSKLQAAVAVAAAAAAAVDAAAATTTTTPKAVPSSDFARDR
jgi:hypothetical protein